MTVASLSHPCPRLSYPHDGYDRHHCMVLSVAAKICHASATLRCDPSVCLFVCMFVPFSDSIKFTRWQYMYAVISNAFGRGSMVGYARIQMLAAGGISLHHKELCLWLVAIHELAEHVVTVDAIICLWSTWMPNSNLNGNNCHLL